MQLIIQSGDRGCTRSAFEFFLEHRDKLARLKYLVLYYVRWYRSRSRSPCDWYWHVMLIGDRAHMWLQGLSWGFVGQGPTGLCDLMREYDRSITYDFVTELE